MDNVTHFKEHVLVALIIAFAVIISGCTGTATDPLQSNQGTLKTVTDMEGRTVSIPDEIERVVVIDDGFVEGILYRFGIDDKIAGIGGPCCQKTWDYSFETADGEAYEFKNGMNPVRYLMPWLKDLTLVTNGNTGINYETLASLDPDLVILREGASAFRAGSEENLQKTISTIESLDIPLIILVGPPYQESPTVDEIGREIHLIGEVFSKEKDADELASYLETQVSEIRKRVEDVPDDEKPVMMQFGLSPRVRQGGGAGMAWGGDTIESYFIEDIANAKNAYGGTGAFVVISTEQILNLDPDVIVLPTAQGYHPAKELYTASYYENLQELSAVKNKRVYSLPWTPYNWAKRLEYPIEVMVIAKAAYPERFMDINLEEWLKEFYQNVYGVDEVTAGELLSAQWMDWCTEESTNFG